MCELYSSLSVWVMSEWTQLITLFQQGYLHRPIPLGTLFMYRKNNQFQKN